jgi:glutathione S-transferase
MRTEAKMKLYDFPFSPNSRKVRAVAYEVGAELEHAPVDLLTGEQRAPAFLARNPMGRVPVLEDGDFVLWESTAIIRYLAAGTKLVPTERRAAADMDRWIAWQLAHLHPAMGKVAFERIVKPLTRRGPPDEAVIEAGTTEFTAMTAILDGALAGKDYVAGALTIADFALAAHYSLAEPCGLDVSRFERVDAWLARMLARASIQRALADAKVPR